jgi:hypothetical protein
MWGEFYNIGNYAKALSFLERALHISSVQTSKKGNYGNFGNFLTNTSESFVTSKNSVISEISVPPKFFKHTFL